jgi:probable phosphoglycerate mutase
MKRIQNVFNFTIFVIVAMALMMANSIAASENTVVFLVRHAEKTADKDDPGLSADGRERSLQLANLLKDAGIEHIHSTDYKRTRETAAPFAEMTGLEIEFYTWDDPPGLAQSLKHDGNRHLVVGHSNTTTELVRLLGGVAGTEIDHSGENDRLYILTINSSGVSTVLIRFGSTYPGP